MRTTLNLHLMPRFRIVNASYHTPFPPPGQSPILVTRFACRFRRYDWRFVIRISFGFSHSSFSRASFGFGTSNLEFFSTKQWKKSK
ncbi:hypothetical protein SBV1_2240014 [Verrucomicrobia bacterium]|nr:hypothetical protein SBV1_2240014 [Verrucomicrobiota bacterium]